MKPDSAVELDHEDRCSTYTTYASMGVRRHARIAASLTEARDPILTLILRRSRTGTVRFYTSASNKRAARPKLYTESLTRDLKLMYSRLTLVRISINL